MKLFLRVFWHAIEIAFAIILIELYIEDEKVRIKEAVVC